MVWIGVLVIVLGVLSLVLAPLDVGILDWADGPQPVLGIVLAVAGMALVAFHLRKGLSIGGRSSERDSVGDGR